MAYDVDVQAQSSHTPIEYSIWRSSEYYLDFDGVDDYVNCGDFFLSDDFSLELRFKTNGAVSSETALISKWSTSAVYEWYLALKSNGQILFAKAAPNQEFPIDLVYYTNNSFDDGNWHQVHAVCDNEVMKIYVDGVDQALTQQNDNGYGGLNNTNIDIIIGDRDGFDTPLDGQIDQVALWSKGLTATEVSNSINSVYAGTETGLEAYYKCDEGSGTTLTDATSNGRDGVINGGASYVQFSALHGWQSSNLFTLQDPGDYYAKCRDANSCTAEQLFSFNRIYETDFDEYSVGGIPNDWEVIYGTLDSGYSIVDIGSGDKVIESDGTSGLHAVAPKTVELIDLEITTKMRIASKSNPRLTTYFRFQDSDNWYLGELTDSNRFQIWKSVNGSTSNVSSDSFTYSIDTFYWIKLLIEGTRLRAKIWQDGNSEPASWLVDVNDSSIGGAGRVGIGFRNDIGQCDYLRIEEV